MTRPGRLPTVSTADALPSVVGDETAPRPGVNALGQSLDLPTEQLRRLPNGSLPVDATDHLVLTLFPPLNAAASVEAAAR